MQLDRHVRSVGRGPLDQRNGHAATPQVEPSRWRDISARSQSMPALLQIFSSFLSRQLLNASKITVAQGSDGPRCRQRLGHLRRRNDRVTGMVLLCSVLGRSASLRFLRTWLGINGFLPFDVTAETEAHSREHLFSKGVLLSRAETGI